MVPDDAVHILLDDVEENGEHAGSLFVREQPGADSYVEVAYVHGAITLYLNMRIGAARELAQALTALTESS